MTDMAKYSDNDGLHGENIQVIMASAGDLTINVPGTGTETTTTKYLNKGSMGKGFVLRPSDNVLIVRIGERTFRDPIPVSTAGWAQTTHIPYFSLIVIRTLNADTNVDLFVM